MTRPARQIAFDFFQRDETDQPVPASMDAAERENQQEHPAWKADLQKPNRPTGMLPSSFTSHEDEQKENGVAAEIQRQNGIKENEEDITNRPAEAADIPTINKKEDQAESEKKEKSEKTVLSSSSTVSPSSGNPASVKSKRGRKSLKTLNAEAELSNVPDDEQLFQRQYYSIGEVATMFGVNASLLRFWESEFSIIQPMKNRKGDRHFRPVDIKNLQLIHDLLRRRKLTIEGAKTFLKNNKKSQEKFEMIRSLQQIKSFLLEIKASL